MEKLLQQIRDNLRFSNWCCFPGNSIIYQYNKDGRLDATMYCREGIEQFAIYKVYDDWGNIIEDRHIKIIHDNGTDNL